MSMLNTIIIKAVQQDHNDILPCKIFALCFLCTLVSVHELNLTLNGWQMLSMAYLANLRPTKGFWNVKKEETFHFLILFQVCLSRLLTKNYFKISFWVLCVPSIPANIGAWAEQAATKSVILIVSVFLTLSINPRMCHERVILILRCWQPCLGTEHRLWKHKLRLDICKSCVTEIISLSILLKILKQKFSILVLFTQRQEDWHSISCVGLE